MSHFKKDAQVIMIGHLAIVVTHPVKALADLGKGIEPG